MKVEANDQEVRAFFEKLQGKQLQKEGKAAIRKGLRILARKTEENYRRNRRGYVVKRRTYTSRSGKQRTKIVHVATVANDRNDPNVVKVHIMADPLARLFEKGTRERRTKGRRVSGSFWVGSRKYLVRTGKGHATGRIRPEWFFRKAQRQTAGQVEEKINSEMKRMIQQQVKL